MIICTCGAKFEGESMFGDAVSHWHAESDKELEKKLERARLMVNREWYRKNKAYQLAWHARARAKRQAAKRQAAKRGAA